VLILSSIDVEKNQRIVFISIADEVSRPGTFEDRNCRAGHIDAVILF